MNQEMVNILPVTLAHATPICYYKTSSPKIIICANLLPLSKQRRKPFMGLSPPNSFPRENDRKRFSQSIIKRVNIKISILLQHPPHSISILIKRNMRLQLMKKSPYQLQLIKYSQQMFLFHFRIFTKLFYFSSIEFCGGQLFFFESETYSFN